MRNFFCTCLLVFMKESVRAEQFLYMKHALQYVNGHAVKITVNKFQLYKAEHVYILLTCDTQQFKDEIQKHYDFFCKFNTCIIIFFDRRENI